MVNRFMKTIDSNSSQFALIVDDGFLRGTLTDGDIRRALLNGQTLDSECKDAMNKEFKFFSSDVGYASMQYSLGNL